MRVLLVASEAASVLRFRTELIEALVDRGHAVDVIVPLGEAPNNNPLPSNVTWHEVPLSRTGMDPWQDLRFLLALIGMFRKARPCYVLAYTMKPVLWAGLASRIAGSISFYPFLTGLGYMFSSHGGLKVRLIRPLLSSLLKYALREAQNVFFLNPDDRALWTTMDLVRTSAATLIDGEGVNLNKFNPVPVPTNGPIRFLFIGRILRDKGVVEFIEAARIVKSRHREVEFHLVGWFDTNPMAISRREVDAWVREGVIKFHGFLDDVRPIVAQCSVFVLPSYREGLPRSVLEAMSTGRPIIVSDAPGCRETVRNGENGFVVPTRSVSDLAAAMEKFVGDRTLIDEMGRRSRELAETRYDVHAINERILHHTGL